MVAGSWHDALAADQLPREIIGNWYVAIERDIAGEDVYLLALQRQQLGHHRALGRLDAQETSCELTTIKRQDKQSVNLLTSRCVTGRFELAIIARTATRDIITDR